MNYVKSKLVSYGPSACSWSALYQIYVCLYVGLGFGEFRFGLRFIYFRRLLFFCFFGGVFSLVFFV